MGTVFKSSPKRNKKNKRAFIINNRGLKKMKIEIGLLGPKGTFTDEALDRYEHQTNIKIERKYFQTMDEVFEALKKRKVRKIIVAIENSIGGTVSGNLDLLINSDFKIEKEIIIPIHHCLAAIRKGTQIKKISSHPQPLSQCARFIKANYPKARIIPSNSTVEAMKKIIEQNDPSTAVIGSKKAITQLKLQIIKENIENVKNNFTRFYMISKKQPDKTGNDKTALLLIPFKDRVGLLRDILNCFLNQKINLTKIESKPSTKKLGEYIFFVEIEGHENDENVKKSLKQLLKICKIKILGAYPKDQMKM